VSAVETEDIDMDDIDLAQDVEEIERTEALLRLKLSVPEFESQAIDPERGLIICLDCDAPIPTERLAANPKAVRCIDCQREHDREQRQESRLYVRFGERGAVVGFYEF
jgi:DnaK suppressor protein